MMRFRITNMLLLALCCNFAVVAAEVDDYQLRDMDGNLHRASDYRGKWLVINFWASWCPPCIREMPEFERFYRNNRDKAHVWGVTFEDSDKEKIMEFVRKLEISYPILGYAQDPLTGYGQVRGLPTTFIIDPDGLFFHRFEGLVSEADLNQLISVQ